MRLMRTWLASALILTWTVAADAQTDFFKTATLSDLLPRPSGMVLADFDNDGALDAAVAGSDAGAVSILVGFNDRTLSSFRSFPAGNVPSSIVTGDFDNDDKLDLVVGNVNDAAVSFLKGDGNAEFEAPIMTENIGGGPVSLAAVDLDNDGKLDLVVANEGATDAAAGSVSILRGQGNGMFTVMGMLDADLGTRAVAVGHIDGDANFDIAVINNAVNTVGLYYGQGNFQFAIGTPLTTGASPKAIVLGDLNVDGFTDIITGDSNADAVSIFRGNGNRTFAARTSASVGTDPTALALEDLNNDGRPDIVSANNRSGDVSLIINEASGLRPARHFVVDQEPLALALGDMDDDGKIDVVTANSQPSVAVAANIGDGTLVAVENVVAGNVPESVAVGDVDNDGLADLVAGGSDGRVLVFRALATGGFRAPTLVGQVGRAIDVALRDFNHDDVLDVAIVDNEASNVVVAKGLGGGRFGTMIPLSVGAGASAVVVANFNGDRNLDGDPNLDLGVSCIGPPALLSVLIGRGDGTFNAKQNTQTEGETPVALDAGDFNCDGSDDVLVANSASSDISVMLSNRNGTFTLARKLTGIGAEPNAVAVADYNRDGHPDFAVGGKAFPGLSSTHVQVGTASCNGTFTQSEESGGELISALAARDVTGDRILDLVATVQINNQMQVSRGTGDGKFTVLQGGRPVVSRMPVGVGVGDFDGDGRYDIVSANSDASANGLSVATNVGAAAVLRGDGNGDHRVSAADLTALVRELFDGDGETIEGAVANAPQSPIGVDANGDGRVDRQDLIATRTRVFTGS